MSRIAKYVVITLIIVCGFFQNRSVFGAQTHSSNKFGIHLAQPQDEDIERASRLVNSEEGGWGYVTLVIQENDRNREKWQAVFDQLRVRRLVPIIRLATAPDGENWKRPKMEDAEGWADFLNSLHWVVKNRYIILFNEPNHATEWGGEVDPESYSEVAQAFAEVLKKTDGDYFIMMGGLDASAPQNLPRYMDEARFMSTVVAEIGQEKMNELFDGLSSHSYPNPGFSGSVYATGRGTVRTYEWELSLLSSLGVKSLPVFITETGWNGDVLSRGEIAENMAYAYENIWIPDSRVVAVTPFVLNYQGEPFLKFSWVKLGNGGEHEEFARIAGLEKRDGDPLIVERGQMDILGLPHDIVEESTYHLRIPVTNAGQAIWARERGYEFELEGVSKEQYLVASFGDIRPHETKHIDIYFSTTDAQGIFTARLILKKNGEQVITSNYWEYEVVPLPTLLLRAVLFPKRSTRGPDFELQLFDEKEEMIFQKKGISVQDGKGSIEKVDNIILGKTYRAVLLKKYYLPRQTYITFSKGENEVLFERMIPLDFDGNGDMNWGDIGAIFKQPKLGSILLP